MAGSEVVAWYKQSVGFGWRALIRNQASASNPIPQADCYLSPPFNSCKLHLLSTGRKEGGVVGPTELFSSACVYAFMNKCLCVHQSACPLSARSVCTGNSFSQKETLSQHRPRLSSGQLNSPKLA